MKEDILDEADYDLENDPNFRVGERDYSGVMEPNADPKITQNIANNLHQVIKEKVAQRIKRKGTDMNGSKSIDKQASLHLNKQWYEMNDMSDNLLDKYSKGLLNKNEILKMQLTHPENSKSYSFAFNKKI